MIMLCAREIQRKQSAMFRLSRSQRNYLSALTISRSTWSHFFGKERSFHFDSAEFVLFFFFQDILICDAANGKRRKL